MGLSFAKKRFFFLLKRQISDKVKNRQYFYVGEGIDQNLHCDCPFRIFSFLFFSTSALLLSLSFRFISFLAYGTLINCRCDGAGTIVAPKLITFFNLLRQNAVDIQTRCADRSILSLLFDAKH